MVLMFGTDLQKRTIVCEVKKGVERGVEKGGRKHLYLECQVRYMSRMENDLI